MSRIIKNIEVEGEPAVALFDTGASFTYVRSSLISEAPIGALTIERWEIKLDRKTGELDLESLRRREFTEF